MALTKQQKILGAVLALGVSAIGIDQLILGGGASGPQTVSASASVNRAVTSNPTPQSPVAPKAPSTEPKTPKIITGHPELSDRLEKLALDQSLAVDGMIDAFVPRGEWAQAKQPESKTQSEPFDQRHTLDAVMAISGEGVAIVDGRTLRLGNLYDGHVLRSISDTSVTFERDGAIVTLTLPGADR